MIKNILYYYLILQVKRLLKRIIFEDVISAKEVFVQQWDTENNIDKKMDEFTVILPPHGSRLYFVSADRLFTEKVETLSEFQFIMFIRFRILLVYVSNIIHKLTVEEQYYNCFES